MTNAPPNRLLLDRLATPLGPMLAVVDETGVLWGLWFTDDESEPKFLRSLRHRLGEPHMANDAALATVRQTLDRYFAGEIAVLREIPWSAAGTPFQQTVWAALTRIPAGATMSYGALAATIGTPRAVRAVGTANGANPIAIVVPCHRVIGANRALTGYGGGLARKRWLLAHEGALLPEPPPFP